MATRSKTTSKKTSTKNKPAARKRLVKAGTTRDLPRLDAPAGASIRDQVAAKHEEARKARRAGGDDRELLEEAAQLERLEAAGE